MHNFIQKLTVIMRILLRKRLIRVLAIGAVGLSVQTVAFEVLGIWLEVLRPSLATIVGAELGVITNFTLNNRFSFNDRAHAPFFARLRRFHLVVLGSIAIQWVCVFTAESLTANIWIIHAVYITGVMLGFISNYTGYRLCVRKGQ